MFLKTSRSERCATGLGPVQCGRRYTCSVGVLLEEEWASNHMFVLVSFGGGGTVFSEKQGLFGDGSILKETSHFAVWQRRSAIHDR